MCLKKLFKFYYFYFINCILRYHIMCRSNTQISFLCGKNNFVEVFKSLARDTRKKRFLLKDLKF